MTQAVDLRPGADGDRIAVIRGGEVSYLPAARVDIGATHAGASGSCRYTRRSANGDLYVCGPGLNRTLFRSTDGGATWSGRRYDLGMDRFELRQMPRDIEDGWIGAFTILGDDTFLMNVMPSNHRTNAESYLARSNDYGATWSVERMELPLGGYRGVAAGNSELVELADGTLLLTMDLWFCTEEEERKHLPPAQQGIAAYVLRSTDGGSSWPEMHCVALHAAEVHLLELPSGHAPVGDPQAALGEAARRPDRHHGRHARPRLRPGVPGRGRAGDRRDHLPVQARRRLRVDRRRPHLGQRAARDRLRAVLGRADAAGRREHPRPYLRPPLPTTDSREPACVRG